MSTHAQQGTRGTTPAYNRLVALQQGNETAAQIHASLKKRSLTAAPRACGCPPDPRFAC